jgi:hypothetical protein
LRELERLSVGREATERFRPGGREKSRSWREEWVREG